ncbi:MAG TPA: DNA-formamidopyrimidine glycosylase family protein [Candidatus Limnocylindrales bacterium]
MPEGDTLFRAAAGLRPHLVGRPVTGARARRPGPQIERVVGSTVTAVESQGKNLLIRFSNGLELRTHLRMNGSWHRYRPGERWRRAEARARVVLEVPGAVAVCFDAPVAELFESRAEGLHPSLSKLGPDLLDPAFGEEHVAEAIRRLRDSGRAAMSISEALLDQRALAGIGNIWRNETLFAERVDPFVTVANLDDATLERLVRRAHELLRGSAAMPPGRGPMRIYGRAGRPCLRCGTLVRSGPTSGELPRTTYWCPRCQRNEEEKR